MTGEPDTSRVMPLVKAMGAPYVGNPHVRCEEGVGVTSPLLYRYAFPNIDPLFSFSFSFFPPPLRCASKTAITGGRRYGLPAEALAKAGWVKSRSG